jgi:Nif-specific regulatory protein
MSESPLDRYAGKDDPRRLEELFSQAEDEQPTAGIRKDPSKLRSTGVPQVAKGYRMSRELARGGQAVVYDAVQVSTGRRVAVKILSGGAFVGPELRARFDREVQILASLRHPNIVQIIDRGSTIDGSLFLVMDLIPGKPLDKFLDHYFSTDPEGPPPSDPSELLRLFLRIAEAVNAAHVRGVIHRDLKPSNIRIDERGEPHILDFGLARPALLQSIDEDGLPEFPVGGFLGSLPWASPEQAEGDEDNLDVRTDVYSLGVILYQMLTGNFPYEVRGPVNTVLKTIITAEPWPPNKPIDDQEDEEAIGERSEPSRLIHPTVVSIILKALAKRRDDRYQSAGDLARDVRSYLQAASELANLTADRATLLALLEATRAMSNEVELERIFRQISSRAAALIKAEAGSVLLYDADRQQLTFRASTGPVGDALIGTRFDSALGIAGEALRTRRPLHVQNTRQSPGFFVGIDKKTGFITRSILAAPLIHRDKMVGVLEVLNPIGRECFCDADLQIVEIFANIAAAAAAQGQAMEVARHDNHALLWAAQPGPIIGSSTLVKEMLRICHSVAMTMSPVLLAGESGTGRQLLAREIHSHSGRREKPCLVLNCAAVPEVLLEGQLFGTEDEGAPGATSPKVGLFEWASGGTLILAEIGAIGPPLQTKLLRVMQDREFTRPGRTRAIPVDVRLLASSSRNLKSLVEAGKFRADLYDLLSASLIKVPPLRERAEDVPLLARYFVGHLALSLAREVPEIGDAAMADLCRYQWPGNILELRNIAERCVILASDRILPKHLPREFAAGSRPSAAGGRGQRRGSGKKRS